MSKQTYRFSQLAQSHLLNIKRYTVSRYSHAQWFSYKATLTSGFQMLADNPGLARRCDEIYPGGFYFPLAQHVVYFTRQPDFILIVAVLGRAQLPQQHLP